MTNSKSMWAVGLLSAAWTLLMLSYLIASTPPAGVYWWMILAMAITSMMAAAGLIFERAWAAYAVYVLGFSIIALWLAALSQMVGPEWPYDNTLSTVLSLVPGIFLLAVCIFSMLSVLRHFRRRPAGR